MNNLGLFQNFEANFEKCCHYKYSKRYVIRKKNDDTCVNPKIKYRIHEADEGMCQVFNSQLGVF